MQHALILSAAAACALIIGGWIFLTTGSRAGAPASNPAVLDVPNAPPPSETIAVGSPTRTPAIAQGFLGMSIEYQSAAADAGPASDPNRVFDRLISKLNPGRRPVIRIGGDSTDHTWWPVKGYTNPGLTYALTPAWMSSMATFASDTDAQLILGINLEVNQPKIAEAEARALLDGIGSTHILEWEVGNEPNLYASFPWYMKVQGDLASGFYTRDRDFSFDQYVDEFNAEAADLPDIRLAGPALGSPVWMRDVGTLIRADPDLADVTYHAYPENCFAVEGNPAYPTIANLLSRTASDGLADEVAPYAAQARGVGREFRVDELNSSACGGTSGVSDTFASALWLTDTLFAMASKGVSGVNIQDFNSSRYKPFGFTRVHGRWVAQVEPMYYGMLLFSRAAPAGSELLSVSTSGADSVRAWAAQTPPDSSDKGARTVTLINDNTRHTETVKIKVPGTRSGTLVRMIASGGVSARRGVRIAGRSYQSPTATGQLTGRPASADIKPGADGTYTVSLPAASAVLMTLSLH